MKNIWSKFSNISEGLSKIHINFIAECLSFTMTYRGKITDQLNSWIARYEVLLGPLKSRKQQYFPNIGYNIKNQGTLKVKKVQKNDIIRGNWFKGFFYIAKLEILMQFQVEILDKLRIVFGKQEQSSCLLRNSRFWKT